MSDSSYLPFTKNEQSWEAQKTPNDQENNLSARKIDWTSLHFCLSYLFSTRCSFYKAQFSELTHVFFFLACFEDHKDSEEVALTAFSIRITWPLCLERRRKWSVRHINSQNCRSCLTGKENGSSGELADCCLHLNTELRNDLFDSSSNCEDCLMLLHSCTIGKSSGRSTWVDMSGLMLLGVSSHTWTFACWNSINKWLLRYLQVLNGYRSINFFFLADLVSDCGKCVTPTLVLVPRHHSAKRHATVRKRMFKPARRTRHWSKCWPFVSVC